MSRHPPSAGERSAGEQLAAASAERLMERYAAGDGEAFEELFRRYERRAYRFFLQRTHSHERAQDLYQELFLRIHRARDRYDPGRAFTPWLFQIAHRLLVDDHRKAFRSHEVPLDGRDALAATSGGERVVAAVEEIERLLGALSPDERYLLVARAEGVGHAELAGRLGRSVEGVRKMASRAVGRLRGVGPLDARS